MNRSLEREIIPRTREFLTGIAKRNIGPQLRAVYEEKLEALKQRRESLLDVRSKDAQTFEPVTSADLSIDAQIHTLWQEEFPDIPVFSEESTDPRLENMGSEELRKLPVVLVVDPIDGSGRLASGSDRFSSSFGLVVKGKPVMAVVYQSVKDILWTAEQGQEGAFRNGKPIHVSDIADLEQAIVSTAHAWDRWGARRRNLRVLKRYFNYACVVGTASSVLDIVDVAQATTDAHVSIGLKPWDMAGSSFLVLKAGGQVTTLTGEDWNTFEDNIIASNGVIHHDLLRVINRNFILDALIQAYRGQFRGDIRTEGGFVYRMLNRAAKRMVFLTKHH